jgi:hypothetical protein
MSKAEDRYLEHFLDGRLRNCSSKEAFLLGYHQAEKDLDISWVKEVSGVKEMKRAKEEALKAYPPRSIAANYDTIARRDAFEYGYLKAEKDNELSWEDMRELHIIFAEIDVDIELCKTDIKSETIGYYEEVLKRFKERKEK